MSTMKRLTARAWERFLADRDEATLLAEMDSAPPWVDPYKPAYPELHRLCDVNLGGQAFRILRFVELESGREHLLVEPTVVAGYDRPGVPYTLQGPALLNWVRDELAAPSDDEETDWTKYVR